MAQRARAGGLWEGGARGGSGRVPGPWWRESGRVRYKCFLALARTLDSKSGLRIAVLTVWNGLSAVWDMSAAWRRGLPRPEVDPKQGDGR